LAAFIRWKNLCFLLQRIYFLVLKLFSLDSGSPGCVFPSKMKDGLATFLAASLSYFLSFLQLPISEKGKIILAASLGAKFFKKVL